MIFSEWIRGLRASLAPVCDEYADYEARQIACTLSGKRFADLIVSQDDVPEAIVSRGEAIVAGRRERIPLAYLLGQVDFAGLTLSVTPDVLIPRADTEILVEEAAARLPRGGQLLDLCTGNGCVALAVLAKTEGTTALGIDLSAGALAVASANAAALSLAERAKFSHADVLSEDFWQTAGIFDVICANPPYIETAALDTLSPEVKREPRLALDGGADGLRFYRELLDRAPAHLRADGALLFEIGYDQRASLAALCDAHGYGATFFRDFGGNDRVLCVKF